VAGRGAIGTDGGAASPSERLAVIGATFTCSAAVSEVVASRAHFRQFAPRVPLVRAGDRIQSATLIIRGRAQELALSIDGRSVLVQEFRTGDLFGEASLLGEELASEDIIAVELTDAAQFTPLALITLIETYSDIAVAMSRLLTRRLAATRRRLVEGVTLSAAGRVHAELLRQARASADLTIRPAPVLSEFAMIVQSTRETVSRTISTLEKRGIIRRDGLGLTVVAPHRLEELVF